jgi:hypothetical protein
MRKVTVLLMALIMIFALSNFLYAEPTNKAETDATEVKKEKNVNDIYVSEYGEWNLNETIHDY